MAKDSTKRAPLQQFEPHPPLNFHSQMVFSSSDVDANGVIKVALQGPSFQVPPGAIVMLRPTNGLAVNANPCYIGRYPEQTDSGALTLPAGADVAIPFPVQNLNQIWVKGHYSDGLVITVTRNAMG